MITEHASFPYSDPLQPEELDMLQRVFDVTCGRQAFKRKVCWLKGWRLRYCSSSKAEFGMNRISGLPLRK